MRIELNSKEIAQALCEYVERMGYTTSEGNVEMDVSASDSLGQKRTVRAWVGVTGKAEAK